MKPLVQAAVIVGLGVRLPWFASRPLWLDEAVQATVSADLVGIIGRSAAYDLHPPLFSAAVAALVELWGPQPWVLRLPALVCSVASIAVAPAVARAWRVEQIAPWLAWGLALAPPLVFYGREGRPFALEVLVALGLLWAAQRDGRALAAMSALAVACSYSLWAVVPLVWIGVALRGGVWVPAVVSGLLVAGAHVPLLWQQVALRGDLAAGPLARWMGMDTPLGLALWPAWIWLGVRPSWLVPIGVFLWAAILASARQASVPLRVIALGPVAVFVVAALLGLHPFGPVRQTLLLAPGVAVMLLQWAPSRREVLAIAAAGAVAGLAVGGPGVPVEDVPAAVGALEDVRGRREVVLVDAGAVLATRLHGGLSGLVVEGHWQEPPAVTAQRAPGSVRWVLLARNGFGRRAAWNAALGSAPVRVITVDGAELRKYRAMGP